MAKITSLASSKISTFPGGYKITDAAHLAELKASTDIVGGLSVGQLVYVNTEEESYVAFITGDHTFAELPKLATIGDEDEGEEE